MARARALLAALLFLGCSSSDDEAVGPPRGEFQRFADALPAVCDQAEQCYGTRCAGPAEGGLMAEWYYDPVFAELYVACLQEVAGEQPRIRTWADCMATSE